MHPNRSTRAFRHAALGIFLAAWVTTGPARAQTNAEACSDIVSIEDRPGYLDAFASIHQGRANEAVTQFQELRQRYATDPDLFMLDYNLACALSRDHRETEALTVLQRAIEGGYGRFGQQMMVLSTDPDLDTLRPMAKFDVLMHEAAELQQRWPQEVADGRKAFVFVPPPLPLPADAAPEERLAAEQEKLPLLLLLHGYAQSHEEFAQPFLEFAAKQRFILLSAAGPLIVAPGRWAWFDSAPDFVDSFRARTQLLWLEVQRLRGQQRIDPERIYVLGYGQGASLAFALASRNPQWVRGGIPVNGALPPAALAGWVLPALHWGRRIDVVHGEHDALLPLDRVRRYVELGIEWGFAWRLQSHPGDHAPPTDLADRLLRAIAWIDEVPFPREAPSQDVMLDERDPPTLEDGPEGDHAHTDHDREERD